MKLIIRWAITILALFLAALIVPGISVDGDAWIAFAVMAVVLGLVNAIVRPILKILSCPLIVLTLGFFVLVINGITLWLSARIAQQVWPSAAFYVDSLGSAFWGALIVSVVSVLGSVFVKGDKDKD